MRVTDTGEPVQQSMSEILGSPGSGSAAPESEPQATGEQTPTSATPAPAEKASPPHDDDDGDPTQPVPRKALIAERKKRQEIERQLAEFKGRLDATERLRQPPAEKKPETPAPDDYDPEFFQSPGKFVEQRVAREMQRASANMRLQLGVELMSQTHPDYFDMERVFVEQARQNPALVAQMHQSGNPAKYAYEWAKAYRQVEGVGSIDELREKIRAEVRAELGNSTQAPVRSLTSPAKPTTSTVGARASGGNSGASNAPPSMADILKGVAVSR